MVHKNDLNNLLLPAKTAFHLIRTPLPTNLIKQKIYSDVFKGKQKRFKELKYYYSLPVDVSENTLAEFFGKLQY